MSAAGERLRAERERFERELRLSKATPDAAVGADDSAHFLADSPRTDDDAVWDLPGDEASNDTSARKVGPLMPTTPYREAMRVASAVDAADAAPAAPPSPKLESPTSDMAASIREALDAAERGLRASVIATDQMERLAASRGMRGVSSRGGETAKPRDAVAPLAAGNEDSEAQSYLKGVLRMIYGGEENAGDNDDNDDDAPVRALRAAVARSRDGLGAHLLGDDSAREAVVARRAHTGANAPPPPARASQSGSLAGAGSAAAPPCGASVPGVDPEPFAFRADAASAPAADVRRVVHGATAKATVTRTTARASAPPPTATAKTDAPAESSLAEASPDGLPPTPTAVKARAASTSPEKAAILDEFHRLERGLAERVAGSQELPATSPQEKPRAEEPAMQPPARAGFPYRPATAGDVIAVTSGDDVSRAPRAGTTRVATVRPGDAHAKAPPPRVDAAPKTARASPAAPASGDAGSLASTIDPAAREAPDATGPHDRTAPAVPDVAAPCFAASDAQTEAGTARTREARRKVEELLGGAFDYEEIRSVARAATAGPGVPADAAEPGAAAPTTPPRVAPDGTARPCVASAVEAEAETDFFADVREAAAFGAGSSFAADPASVVADADASIEAFRAAVRAEVATRIVASASGVSADAAEAARLRRAATRELCESVAAATRPRADARSARTSAPHRRAPPPPRGARSPPPEPPARPRVAFAARAEADFVAGRSRSAPARERPGASWDGTVASFAGRSSEAPARLTARVAAAREAARRRDARAARAARAREAAEKRREAETEKAEATAEARRAAAERKRVVAVAFGRRAGPRGSEGDVSASGARSDGERGAGSARRTPARARARPRATEVKPFKLSAGNHSRSKEELLAERENRPDPDVWEPSPAKSAGRLESEAGEDAGDSGRSAPATPPDASGRGRRERDADKAEVSSEEHGTSPRLDAARRARDELKRRSRAAARHSRIVHAASEAAAPAIAAAEEARRDADAAAAAAARAAAAASAAEALMMAEARRLRERSKALYSRSKDARFAPARAATPEMDDAPLMASTSSLPDASLAAAREAAEERGRDAGAAAWPRTSESPEKPPLRVSASLASPSPVKPPKLPVAGGPRQPVQYNPSRCFGGEDAYAAFDRAPAPPERRPAVEPFAFAAEDDGVATPPSPRSPAVSWKMGSLELPETLLPEPPGKEHASEKASSAAEPDAAEAAVAAAASTEPPRLSVPAVLRRAAEARVVLAAGGGGAERGASGSEAHETLSEPAPEASGRRLLLRGDDLRYTPPAKVSVEKDETARDPEARAADGSSDGDSVTDYGSLDDGESRESDGDSTAAAAAAVAEQLARSDTEA